MAPKKKSPPPHKGEEKQAQAGMAVEAAVVEPEKAEVPSPSQPKPASAKPVSVKPLVQAPVFRMISEALDTLKEPNGSALPEIMKYVRQKYAKELGADLDMTLTVALKRSIATGQLLKLQGNRYILASKAMATQSAPKKRGRPPKAAADKAAPKADSPRAKAAPKSKAEKAKPAAKKAKT